MGRVPIIAFGHQSRVGKDTCMQAVIAYARRRMAEGAVFPFTRIESRSMSYTLKRVGELLFSAQGFRPWDYYETPEGAPLRDVPLSGVGLTPTEICIELGDKLRQIYDRVFIEAELSKLTPDTMSVFTSLRFTNEGLAIQAAGGWCVKVVRPDAPPPLRLDAKMDPCFPWNRVIVNDGSKEELEQKAVAVFEDYLKTWS